MPNTREITPSAVLAAALFAIGSLGCATGNAGDGDGSESRPDASNPVRPDAAPFPDASGLPLADASPDAPPQLVTCTEDATLACGDLVEHTLFLEDATVQAYSCELQATAGVDKIYRFVPATTGSVTLALDVIDDAPLFGDDLDLYVLEGECGASACAAQASEVGDESLTFEATAGTTYFIVVEAFAAGFLTFQNYDLTVTCT